MHFLSWTEDKKVIPYGQEILEPLPSKLYLYVIFELNPI